MNLFLTDVCCFAKTSKFLNIWKNIPQFFDIHSVETTDMIHLYLYYYYFLKSRKKYNKTKAWFAVFANSHGINTATMADFNLLM